MKHFGLDEVRKEGAKSNGRYRSFSSSSSSDEESGVAAIPLEFRPVDVRSQPRRNYSSTTPAIQTTIPQLQLDELNTQSERTILHKFGMGAAFGGLLLSSQILFYWALTAGSSEGFGAQLDKLNVVPEAVDSLFARTLLSYAAYAAGAAIISGCLNLARKAWQEHKKPSDAYGEEFSEYKKHR